jgi:hypothetical protein
MILDIQETFSLAQAVTAVGDTPSTNVYDTGSTADQGIGDEVIYVYAKVKAAFTTAAGGALQVVLQHSTDNSTFTDVQVLTPVTAVAALTANTTLVRAALPIGLNRYLRLAYRIATGVMTAGTVDAYLTLDVQANNNYAGGFVIA